MAKIRKRMIKAVLEQRGKLHEEYGHINGSRLWRAFYTFKSLICLLIGRQGDNDADDVDAMARIDFERESNFEGTFHSWTELAVGYGIFRRWYYDIYENGD